MPREPLQKVGVEAWGSEASGAGTNAEVQEIPARTKVS